MNSPLRLLRIDRNAIVLLIALMMLFATPLIGQQIEASDDYSMRIAQAYNFYYGDTTYLLWNAPAFSILIYLMYSLLPLLGWIGATILLSTLFYIATVVVIYRVLAAELPSRSLRTIQALVILTLALVVIQPISLTPLINTAEFLVQWINISPHHNPTSIAIRGIVLILTLIAVNTVTNNTRYSWQQTVGVMLMVIFSTLIKPNWLMAFLPVYAVVVLFAWWRGIAWDKRMVLLGFGVSSVLALTITFGLGIVADNSDLVVRIFTYELTPVRVIKMLLSIAFPLYVAVVWHKELVKDYALLFAWGVFATGVVQGLIFDEAGFRAGHGNFFWGQSIAGWVLFVLTVRLYIRQTNILWQTAMPTSWIWRIATLLLTLHTITGVLWWVAHYGTKPVLFP